jgi:hypothetical protein
VTGDDATMPPSPEETADGSRTLCAASDVIVEEARRDRAKAITELLQVGDGAGV